jgi:hypothetical protein
MCAQHTKKLKLGLKDYPGGLGIWAAVSPIYDTVGFSGQQDIGVHIHGRKLPRGEKELDDTFDVIVLEIDGGSGSVKIDRANAIAFTFSTLGGLKTSALKCTRCDTLHLDEGYLAMHRHHKHICRLCGKELHTKTPSIGNPLAIVGQSLLRSDSTSVKTEQVLEIKQSDFAGGIRLWTSHNPAVVMLPGRQEVEGVHIHCYEKSGARVVDGTFKHINIDGIIIESEQARLFTIQANIEMLLNCIVSENCPYCGEPHFDIGENAWEPHTVHTCYHCTKSFSVASYENISNPLLGKLANLRARFNEQTCGQ